MKLGEIAELAPLAAAVTRGTILGGCYRILRPIAEGGCGEVFLAAHTRTNGRFAVKVLRRDVSLDSEAAQRFSHEAEITATIRHPHVVQVFDFNITEAGVPFLVMELVEGERLSDRLARDGSLEPTRALRIIEQIAHALAAAHEHGIVHRDLKPDNVMLVAANGVTDFVKLLDFGISKASWRPELSQPNVITGTPEYMAPEQAAVDTARIGPRTDQWALAAIAYECLTGVEPFPGETPLAVLDQVANAAPIAPSDLAAGLGAEVDAVILRGLSKDPADRYPDVTAFSTALDAAFGLEAGGTASPATETPAPPAARPSVAPPPAGAAKTLVLFRRRRWRRFVVAGVVSSALLLAAVGIAGARWRSSARGPRFARWTQAVIAFAADRLARFR